MIAQAGAEINRCKVCVVGLGYIGLPTAVVLASKVEGVSGYDIDTDRCDRIRNGISPFQEAGLDELLKYVVGTKRLEITQAVPSAETFLIAVPTPLAPDKSADLSFLGAAIEAIAPKLTGDELILVESTCPPGTTQTLKERVTAIRPDLADAVALDRLGFAYCPERVLPGNILQELASNDRIIGGLTGKSSQRAAELYESFCVGRMFLTDARTAEVAKLAENAYRDVNIAFANELEQLCESHGVDIWELRELANRHPRVNILQPGPGVGGHCIAVDPWFLTDREHPAPLIRTARELNDAKPAKVAAKVLSLLKDKSRPRVLALGLAFKENVDDTRQSPAIEVIKKLAASQREVSIFAVDPLINACPAELRDYPAVSFSKFLPSDFSEFDAIVLLVAHEAFAELRNSNLSETRIVDTRGVFRAINQH